MQGTPDLTSDTIGDALLAKRKQRRLDQGRAAGEIGVSPSTYRSYEKNTQRPSVNVFPLLAKFLGLEMEDFLQLYGATVIFALRPALERELALLNGQAPSAPQYTPSHSDAEDSFDDEDEAVSSDNDIDGDNSQEELHESGRESFSYQREEVPAPSSPSDAVAQAFEDPPVAVVVDEEDDDDDDDDDDDGNGDENGDEDEDEEEEDDDEAFFSKDMSTENEAVSPSSTTQFTGAPSDFAKSSKPKKKKKKKKR